ncbi:carbohydrate ABC transporter permease [Streptococcus cuniculi]|uniref:Sugar ABC transporter permease n=1 Tax=Streptococcus cuniculi TaxID=1432788 RepID=A0A4Y9J9V2_9STRE|nr:sugar ABC transporter permease [Streptococcus cuniculi]MBF0778399.1 sugar ABC transporter permease [Streptococcus cuniculi]TFU97682.1 sugar ABC transporter permease [Streptococcus cuniculi]
MNSIYKKWFVPFVLPAVVLFAMVVLIPFIVGFLYSFSAWRGVYFAGGQNVFEAWVGFENYIKSFQNEHFRNAFIYTIQFTALAVVVVNFISFAQALLLHGLGKCVGIFRATFFLPNLLGGLALGYIWLFIYENVFSTMLFGEKGLLPFDLLTNMTQNANKNLLAMLMIVTWQMSGYMMIIYVTGLATIPDDLYEAAAMDGANYWQKLRHVTLPMLMPSFTVVFFLVLSGCFKLLDPNVALTNGEFNTRMLALQILRVPKDTSNNYGMAQAQAVIFFIIIAVVSLTQVVMTKRKEIEAQ